MKICLKNVLKNAKLSINELNTILVEIKGKINSRL